MPFVEANGLRFHIQRLGAGEPTVVFIHGLAVDNLSSWWYTIANAVARNADVLLYDLRGHGLTERPTTGYGVAQMVDDLSALLGVLGIDHPVCLVGMSFGGLIAAAFAIAHPERTAGLVLIEAHVAIEGQPVNDRVEVTHLLNVAGLTLDEQEIQDWLDQFAGRKLNRLARSTEDLICNSTLIEDLSDTPPFSPHELAAIRCPTIAIFGENSDIFERGVLIEQLVPQAELRVVPESAHSVLTEHTREIRHLVLGWLAERSPAATGGG